MVESESVQKTKNFAPVEVRFLALEGCETGLNNEELAELAKVSSTTIVQYCGVCQNRGTSAPCRKPSTPRSRGICTAITQRIVDYRKKHLSHGGQAFGSLDSSRAQAVRF